MLSDRQIPSILSYINGEEYHGTQAKNQLVRNAANTVAHFRDFIGRKYVYLRWEILRSLELKPVS